MGVYQLHSVTDVLHGVVKIIEALSILLYVVGWQWGGGRSTTVTTIHRQDTSRTDDTEASQDQAAHHYFAHSRACRQVGQGDGQADQEQE